MTQLIELCKKIGCEFAENEPMSKHTTFKIGGNARLVVYPESLEQICEIAKTTQQCNIRLFPMGNGSNLLVDDDGIDACVMIFDDRFGEISINDDGIIFAQSGAMLIKLCRFAYEHSLSGLEFAYGIPGSCGGGVFMNAGAYGGEMKDVVIGCQYVDKNGNVGELSWDSLDFSYRYSAFYKNGFIITGIYLKLEKGVKEEIKAKMDDLITRRRTKQPLEFPSAGSTFKRPAENYAGALIEQCGLKGRSVGGAQVSEKHAGFVINKGGATCKDVMELCQICIDTVYENTGITLEKEIRVTK